MQRRIVGFAACAAAVIVCVACSTEPVSPRLQVVDPARDVSSAQFGATSVSSRAASHDEGFLCGMGPAGLTRDSRVVVTSAGTGLLTCRTIFSPGPATPMFIRNTECGVGDLTTTDVLFVWAPSGEASLTCRFKR
jgi:hypothetical protein